MSLGLTAVALSLPAVFAGRCVTYFLPTELTLGTSADVAANAALVTASLC
jgi:hypothetical protein